MHSFVVEGDGIRTYGVAVSNTLSLNLIALKFIVENKRETDEADEKPSKKFGLNRSTSVIKFSFKNMKKPCHCSNDKAFLVGAGAGFEPATFGL